jgi:hypothetical protein
MGDILNREAATGGEVRRDPPPYEQAFGGAEQAV